MSVAVARHDPDNPLILPVAASGRTYSATWQLASQRRRTVVLLALAIALSLVLAPLALASSLAPAVLVYGLLGLVAIACQPKIGLYVAVAMAIIFENLTDDPLMAAGRYLYSGVSGSVISPLEAILLLSLATLLVRRILGEPGFRGGALWRPMLVFAGALGVGLAYGIVNGGAPYIAMWEVRFLLYIVVTYFLAVNSIRTKTDLRLLTACILLATTAYAVEGAYRKIALIDTGRLTQDLEDAWGHDSAIFISHAIMLVAAQWAFGGQSWQRRVGLLAVPILIFTLMASHRRAGNVTLIVSFLVYSLVFLVANRKAFFLLATPVLLCGMLYFPLFWNNTGLLGQPARAVRSMITPDARDQSSNYYREVEKVNVRATIMAYPIMGVGFGREFLFVIPLADLSFWTFWRYEPHNNVLWVWLKIGAIGFTCFWTLMGTAIVRAAHLARTLRGRDERSFALFALAVVVSSLVFCWVDTGLTFPRFTTILGAALGALGVLHRLENGEAPEASARRVTDRQPVQPGVRYVHP